jgi:cell wall-associated NlpC family hydrolase
LTLQDYIARRAEEFAEKKVPYRHRGTTEQGCDCTGLLIAIVRSLGYLAKYTLPWYARDWNLHSNRGDHLSDQIGKFADAIPKSQSRPGDVLLFKFGKCIAHAAVLVRVEPVGGHLPD